MPFVIVEMWQGRSVEQKRNLVKADSWGRAGTLGIDMAEEKK